MYRVAICDDEPAVLNSILQALAQFSYRTGIQLQPICYTSGEALLAADLTEVDILLLDIQMGGISGMDAARQLRRQGADVCLIFLTSMVQYALEGYEVHPFGFLPKTITAEVFEAKITEAVEWITAQKGAALVLKTGSETSRFYPRDILYIDILDHKARVVAKGGHAICYTTLNQLEKELDGRVFFRCHKSYLLNLQAVQTIAQDYAVVSNGDRVPVSKHRRSELLSAFARFLREQP